MSGIERVVPHVIEHGEHQPPSNGLSSLRKLVFQHGLVGWLGGRVFTAKPPSRDVARVVIEVKPASQVEVHLLGCW